MSSAGLGFIKLNNDSDVDIDFVAELMGDMLDNKVIIHNNRRLDSGDIDEALDFLIEKMKDKFSMIKENLRENEVRIGDNNKLDLRKQIDYQKLRLIMNKLKDSDKRKRYVELGLDDYSIGDREGFMNKAIIIYLVKYCDVKTVSDILVSSEELDYNVTYKTLFRYVDELENDGIIEIFLDGEDEVLRYVGLDHLSKPDVLEYIEVLAKEIKAMSYGNLIRECKDIKAKGHVFCDRFRLIMKEIVDRRSNCFKRYNDSMLDINAYENIYLDPTVNDKEMLAVALDMIVEIYKDGDCSKGSDTIAEEFNILRNDVVTGRVDRDGILDRVRDIKRVC